MVRSEMFPSSGYFRGLDCPFYASGLCERPYCHYRHAKQSSEKGKKKFNEEKNTRNKKKKQTLEPWNGEARKEKNKREDTILYKHCIYLFRNV